MVCPLVVPPLCQYAFCPGPVHESFCRWSLSFVLLRLEHGSLGVLALCFQSGQNYTEVDPVTPSLCELYLHFRFHFGTSSVSQTLKGYMVPTCTFMLKIQFLCNKFHCWFGVMTLALVCSRNTPPQTCPSLPRTTSLSCLTNTRLAYGRSALS